MEYNFQFTQENRLPKLYISAVRILKAVKTEGKSLNNTLYSSSNSYKVHNIQACAGLVAKALQHSVELDNMYKFIKSKNKEEVDLDEHKAYILMTQLVWGKGCLPKKNHNTINLLNQYQDELRAMANPTNYEDKSQVALPRHVRINVLRTTEDQVLNDLANEGWIEQEGGPSYSTYLKRLAKLKEPYFMKDFHYPEVLAFPPRTQLFDHPLCQQNALILQAKSTCMPVKLLNPRPGSVVLDMCAAPGMKTSQLAAHMNDIGVIHAVELDPGRYATLQQILKNTGVTCAKTYNNDALVIQPSYFSDVTHILVDPSCSGSGMYRAEMTSKTLEQVENLAKFQYRSLCKAMTFPSVRRIVYSTCSVYEQENEAVVSDALAYYKNFKLVDAWPDATKGQLTRGSSSYPGGEMTIYILPEKDLSTGFFVAVIERVSKKKEKKKKKEEINEEKSIDVNPHYPSKSDKTRHNSEDYSCTAQVLDWSKEIAQEETDEHYPTEIREKKKKKKQDTVDYGDTLEIENEDTAENFLTDVKERKKKHNNKHDHSILEVIDQADTQCINEEVKKRKKKKKHDTDIQNEEVDMNTDQHTQVKERKKKKKGDTDAQNGIEEIDMDPEIKKRKKKKKHDIDVQNEEVDMNTDQHTQVKERKKKKKSDTDAQNGIEEIGMDPEIKKRKKKKNHDIENQNNIEEIEDDSEKERNIESSQQSCENIQKKRKKKHNSKDYNNSSIEIENLDTNDQISTDIKEKKKKKKYSTLQEQNGSDIFTDQQLCVKKDKKKKKHDFVTEDSQISSIDDDSSTYIKEKKKKKKRVTDDSKESNLETRNDLEDTKVKKKKKKDKENQDLEYLDMSDNSHKCQLKSKKRKLSLNEHDTYESPTTTEMHISEKKKDKKKKKCVSNSSDEEASCVDIKIKKKDAKIKGELDAGEIKKKKKREKIADTSA